MPQIVTAVLFIIFSLFVSDSALAQTADAAAKTGELVAALGKTKYKRKEKKGVVTEFYLDIKNQAVVKSSAADYSGSYVCESGEYRLELRVSSDSKIEGDGFEPIYENSDLDKPESRKFTLQNAKIDGALLTATKVYEGGKTKNFEAVFVTRTVRSGKNPNEIATTDTKYGLGFIESNDMFTNRVFCEFKR